MCHSVRHTGDLVRSIQARVCVCVRACVRVYVCGVVVGGRACVCVRAGGCEEGLI